MLARHYVCLVSGGSSGLRASVDGRREDVFRYGTTTVHPFALSTALLRAGQVREYQVRQTARGADITVVADAGLDDAALTAAVEQSLRQAGITQPQVTINRAQAIARDPRTGKARRFVPSRHRGAGASARLGSVAVGTRLLSRSKSR
jgi:phenylacetate-CoA ligase